MVRDSNPQVDPGRHRIDQEHRLVYAVSGDELIVIAAGTTTELRSRLGI